MSYRGYEHWSGKTPSEAGGAPTSTMRDCAEEPERDLRDAANSTQFGGHPAAATRLSGSSLRLPTLRLAGPPIATKQTADRLSKCHGHVGRDLQRGARPVPVSSATLPSQADHTAYRPLFKARSARRNRDLSGPRLRADGVGVGEQQLIQHGPMKPIKIACQLLK